MDQQKQKIVIEIEFTGSSKEVALNVSASHKLDFDGIYGEVLEAVKNAKSIDELTNFYDNAIAKNTVFMLKQAVLDGMLNDKINAIFFMSQTLLGEVVRARLDKMINEHEAGE